MARLFSPEMAGGIDQFKKDAKGNIFLVPISGHIDGKRN